MRLEYIVGGNDFPAIGSAASQVKQILARMNIDDIYIGRAVVVLYEVEANIIIHAGEGRVCVEIDRSGVEVKATDKGPGITDIEQAMEQGYSTAPEKFRRMGFGAGMGLGNIGSNADSLSIMSDPGEGTTLDIKIGFARSE